MHWNDVREEWHELSAKFKQKWAKLTDEDLHRIGGEREVLIQHVGTYYKLDEPEAEKHVDEFVEQLEQGKRKGKRKAKAKKKSEV